MAFSKEWDRLYQQGLHKSVWPWSEIVALVMKYAKNIGKKKFRVLELGCGAGANIPFFQSLGVDYFAIEGSKTTVTELCKRFPMYEKNIVIGDFTKSIPFDDSFDLIFDRASITHNPTSAIRDVLVNINNHLKKNGLFIGVDWFSTEFSEYSEGQPAGDDFTRNNFDSGNLAGTGTVHFADESHLRDLFKEFDIEYLEHKTVSHIVPNDGWQFGAWNIVVRSKKDV